jgi:perosamine synthetase
MVKKITLGCLDVTQEDLDAVDGVLHSGWISPGPKVAEFESAFAKAHGRKYGVMVNSGTDALRIALGALKEARGWGDGDQVVVPALTFIATANVVLQNNLTPVFAEVDSRTFNLDPEHIQKYITHRTRAAIPVHLFGQMADMPQLRSRVHLPMIEDSCETMGTRRICNWGSETGITDEARANLERSVGSFGEIACFSTYACHLINTGVGGIAITDDEQLYQIMRSLMNHGRRSESTSERFTFDRVGYSCRPTEFEAVLGLNQLKRLPDILRKRQSNAEYLDKSLYGTEDWLQRQSPIRVNVGHAWMMYPLLLTDPSINREEFLAYLQSEGVECRPFFPLLTSPIYRQMFPDAYASFPVAFNATQRGFYVGCHQQLHPEDLLYIACTIKEAYAAQKKETALASA